IVPGGGVAFLRASTALESMKLDVADEQVGVNIVKRALQEPVRQIATNAGHEGAVIVGKILEKKDVNYGFNADTEVFGDLVKDGVIDPTMVTRTALQNAASIASLLLTTEALVTEIPEKKAPAPAGPPPGMY
ncbi:MAG: chaperonin GroEL, partial [Acidobacteriota bacterium]